MAGWPKAVPRTTFAVFRPTPGSAQSSSIVCGTRPSCRSTRMRATAWSAFAFWRKNPVGLTIASSASPGAAASSCGPGYSANRRGVTWFTIASVHCAERMVATSSCHGFW